MMHGIKLNGEWRLEDLKRFVEPLEIYDADETFIGLFIPANMERGKAMIAAADARVDRVEIERRLREETGGIPLRQTIERMKALEEEMLPNGAAKTGETVTVESR